MIHQILIDKLENNLETFKSLFIKITQEQARWKPQTEKWSLLEVLNHLFDEEQFDFRQRIEFALGKCNKEWTRIQPVLWVEEKKYNSKDFSLSLENFLVERIKSISWLRGLTSPDWSAVDNYPFGIVLTAEQSLVNWLAHDYLHMRQITSLNWSYLSHLAPTVELNYAGNW